MKSLFVVIVFLIAFASVSNAMQSTNYVIDESVFNIGGNTSTSFSYDVLKNSIGECIVG